MRKALVRKCRAATRHPCTELIIQVASMWSQDVAGASVHCAPIVGEYSFGTGADTHSAGKPSLHRANLLTLTDTRKKLHILAQRFRHQTSHPHVREALVRKYRAATSNFLPPNCAQGTCKKIQSCNIQLYSYAMHAQLQHPTVFLRNARRRHCKRFLHDASTLSIVRNIMQRLIRKRLIRKPLQN